MAKDLQTTVATIAGEAPVTREQGETPHMWGKRRKAQVMRWYTAGVEPRTIATLHRVPITYVNEVVGIRSPGYEWVAPDEIVNGPFPTFEEAWREEPLVPEEPGRLTTEQAIARAVQMYRWLLAGLTMQEIGERHHVSKERVRRILDKYGLWGRYRTTWKSGEEPKLAPIEDETTANKTWFFRRKKGLPSWWELPEENGGHDEGA